MKYKDEYETLDNNVFEQMAREYFNKTDNYEKIGALKFDKNNTFRSQLEKVLNCIYEINLNKIKNKQDKKYDKNLTYNIQLDILNKKMFVFYTRLYSSIYLMPMTSYVHKKMPNNYEIKTRYFLLLKALLDCDYYMLKEEDRMFFKSAIMQYFKLIFKIYT